MNEQKGRLVALDADPTCLLERITAFNCNVFMEAVERILDEASERVRALAAQINELDPGTAAEGAEARAILRRKGWI